MNRKARKRSIHKPVMTKEQLTEMVQHTREIAQRSSATTDARLKELHSAYEHQHDPVLTWQEGSGDSPSNDRLVNCQVWTNLPDGGMLKEFGVPLRYRVVSNIGSWWTKDNRSFNGWVTYWRDFE